MCSEEFSSELKDVASGSMEAAIPSYIVFYNPFVSLKEIS